MYQFLPATQLAMLLLAALPVVIPFTTPICPSPAARQINTNTQAIFTVLQEDFLCFALVSPRPFLATCALMVPNLTSSVDLHGKGWVLRPLFCLVPSGLCFQRSDDRGCNARHSGDWDPVTFAGVMQPPQATILNWLSKNKRVRKYKAKESKLFKLGGGNWNCKRDGERYVAALGKMLMSWMAFKLMLWIYYLF